MYRLSKALKKYGIIGVIIKITKKVTYKIFKFFDDLDQKYIKYLERLKKKKSEKKYEFIRQLCNKEQYENIYVFYPYTEWNLPIFQRPQQIALELSKDNKNLYFFCTANTLYDNVDIYEKINDNLYITTEYEFISKIDTNKRILHLYSTDIVSTYDDVEQALKRKDRVLYEYIDEIHVEITHNLPEKYLEKHKKILKNEKCFVVTTAEKLYQDVKNMRSKNFILATNGVNIEDFKKDDYFIPKAIEDLKDKYSVLVGYYGALAKWVDYELIKKSAIKYPNYAFVLIGMEYDSSLKDSKILELENVKFLGKVNYTELVNYSKNFDLLTIPFLVNEITESTSPVKLFEYMATQIPILTTNMRECRKYRSVIIGKNSNDYINKIKSTIKLKNDKEYLKLEMKEALENTWEQKAKAIDNLISKRRTNKNG